MRRLAVFAGAFSAGIFLAQYLLRPEWLLPGALVCLGLGWASFLLPWEIRRRSVAACAALALALGWNWLYIRQVQRPLEALAGTEGPAVMTLCGYGEETDYGARAVVKLEGYSFGKAVFYGDASLLELEPGQTLSGTVRFQSAAKIRDTDVTSFTSKGVFLLAYGRGEMSGGSGSMSSLRWRHLRLGRAMAEKIWTLYPDRAAGFLTAILTGDKSGLAEGDAIALSEAGLYHIMAVSGMHCGFLLTLASLLTGKRRRLTAALVMPLLAFYALLTGGSPSVVRACVMLAFLLAAPLCRRDSDPPTALAAALFLILLVNPFAAASVSLQLSFAAMAGLLWLTPKLMKLLAGERRRGRAFRLLSASFSATIGALVFTTPLTAWYFGRLVLVSPLSNLLCLWAAGIVFMTGLLSVAAGFVWTPLGAALALLPRALTGYILGAARLLAGIPYHALYYTNPYLKYWLAYAYVLFALAYVLRPKRRRKYAAAALLAALALVVTVGLGQRCCRADLDVLVLNVGQGQCVLLASEGRFALVDCGSGNSWISAGDIAADHLASLGCKQLDYLILTHCDSDHVSGVTALAERLRIGVLLAPETAEDGKLQTQFLSAAKAAGAAVVSPEEIRTIPLGGAALTVYPPVGTGGDNAEGLAVLASAGDLDLLVTGDMDRTTEKKLLAAYDLPDLEILIAGHHGSRHSTSEELLEALRPETACVSAGSNAYGHPSEEVLERLARQGCAVFRTDLHGDIHLSLNQEN
ncbi:DNA internalization-related competence protein ComEC/Rec2 [Oscillibacter sp.]|uniref:DNA internalization-related competence protein ComEC/Rec2 n=1 Tax=Oscillibacter sp. TaxID=1945593 RepID=UPI0021717A85|nr:DNA internalization-related competence protein ComEC/Rec2 [Oscillibacter sp.]MCI9648099.1 DNA internalization-related competence protein ComEC/Rec2 [Oscillibacter sp.]